MICSIVYQGTMDKYHHYHLVDTQFTVSSAVTSEFQGFIHPTYDEIAIIIKEYSNPSRRQSVAPNIALHLVNKYFNGQTTSIRFKAYLDKVCEQTKIYYPYADVTPYLPCILRQFDRLKWAQNFKH